jgi:hypothetical protein
MECFFADVCRAPRFIYKEAERETGTLEFIDINDRLSLGKPKDGDFSVESDREVMKLLESTGEVIAEKLRTGTKLYEALAEVRRKEVLQKQ